MDRKNFIEKVSAATLIGFTGIPFTTGLGRMKTDTGKVYTTTGPINSSKMGTTLIHEHIITIFGAPAQEPARYDQQQVLKEVIPYLKYIKSLGCDTIVDCSAMYLGRNASLLKKLSEQSGVNILTSTGIYGAADDDYVPDYAYRETSRQLADRWIDEFENGIQETGVRPGFVKIGVDQGPLSDIDAKLVRAAAKTHLETGLLLQIHTSDNPVAASQQLKILRSEGVKPEAWVWVHAQNVGDTGELIKAARKGAWISLDGLRTPNFFNGFRDGSSTLMDHFKKVQKFKEEGLLDRVMLSHDGSTFPPNDRPKRPYDVLFNSFIPMLKAGGFTKEQIHQLTVTNPAKAFGVRVHKI